MSRRNVLGALVVLTLSSAFLLTAMVASASAAPLEPTLGLSALQSRLDAAPNGVLHGYMKTVVHGATIEQISLDVKAITASGSSDSVLGNSGDLILFEATGPEIAASGGIALGMSGSPVYVTDSGTDKLVGAVSYGDFFTLGGTGLATPIEDMIRLQTDYSATAAVRSLSRPVESARGVASSVFITTNPSLAEVARSAGQFVVRPLASVAVGGLPARSPGFQAYQRRMEGAGFSVLALGSSQTASSYSAPFQAGSAISVLTSRGDMWSGGIGTVTYADGKNIVALGHPAFWKGSTSLDMATAWIDGIWPSTYEPYKMATPGALRGTITQDRNAGVLGIDGLMPEEAVITASAKNLDTGRAISTRTFMPSYVMNSNANEFAGLPQLAAYVAAVRLYDSFKVGGSATTTTTVVVSDGTDTYTLQKRDVFDSGTDIATALCGDVSQVVTTLQWLNQNGLSHADILSVDLQSAVTNARNSAELVGVECPAGLKWGDNRVVLRFAVFGVAETQTVDATLTIPAGTPLTGAISVIGGADNQPADGLFPMPPAGVDRRTVSRAVSDMRAQLPNTAIDIAYTPGGSLPPSDGGDGEVVLASAAANTSVETSANTSWYVTGEVDKTTTSLTARAFPATVPYGGSTILVGSVNGLNEPSSVAIYGRPADSSESTLVARVPVSDAGTFVAPLFGLRRNTAVTCRFEGDDSSLASEAVLKVKVAARVVLRASRSSLKRGQSVSLSASVVPSTSTGVVVFEAYTRRGWVRLGTGRIIAGKATFSWRPGAGARTVRARYAGSSANAGTTSGSVRIIVR